MKLKFVNGFLLKMVSVIMESIESFKNVFILKMEFRISGLFKN